MATKNPNYSPEFKQKIVASHRSGQTQNKLAREYGCSAHDHPQMGGGRRVVA